MKKLISASSFCRLATGCMLLVLTVQAASAATVRGQLNRRSGAGAAPAAGVCVTVYSQKGGRSARVCSNSQGMYYLANIVPGDYQLEIWTSPSPGAPPIRYPIRVQEPNTDVDRITLP